ncbi:hypothetical protein WN943_007358 [Citrus x changshan-huyou]
MREICICFILVIDCSAAIELQKDRKSKEEKTLVVGLSLGGGFLVGGVVLIIWLAGIGRKRKEGDEEDNQGFSEYIDDEFERGAGPKSFFSNWNVQLKHGKAVVLRKGLFRDIKNSTGPYGGEALAATQESVKARDSKIRCMAELNFCS